MASEYGQADGQADMTLGDDQDPTWVEPPRAIGVGHVIRDRFVLEAELGSGGMGRVYKALDLRRQEALDRHPYVAVKLLTHSFQQHPASLVALQREARRAQTLAHPNIIRVFDFDRDGSLIYLVMEYLRGRTLGESLSEPGFAGLAFDKAMAIIRPVGEALAFAHDHRIVHSDLKPSNIFLTDDGQVKVIDFGIARAFQRPDAATGEATLFDASSLRAFSPLYASPEMIDGDEEADPRDDIFSLACISYELISGNHPFGRKSAVVARSKGQSPEKPWDLTGAQWSALRRGFAFSRTERTATIELFLARLDRQPPWSLRLPEVKRAATVRRFQARFDPRCAWNNLRQLAGRAAATFGRVLARLDPRPAWNNLRLPAGRAAAILGSFLARVDPRPIRKSLGRLAASLAADLRGFLARLGSWPVWEKRRLLVATIAIAMTVASGVVWLNERDLEQTASKEPEDVSGAPATPGPVEEPAGAAPDQPPEREEDVLLPNLPPPGTPRSSFLDCDQCPEMIVIPAGRFQMGAPATDIDAEPEEQPRREVAIDTFALGRYEITEREWGACANDGFCRNVQPMSAISLSDTPKTHVSWQDAQDFILWLNGKTGRSYRLPTEAEWEYAARAGKDTRYPWGDQIGANNANCRDCGAPTGGLMPAPVGSYAPNGFGLFDMVGNVWEWTADCGENRRESGANTTIMCSHPIARGGSWDNSASAVRVTQRLSARADVRENNIGFRVARDLP